jgi:hypothetical protein
MRKNKVLTEKQLDAHEESVRIRENITQGRPVYQLLEENLAKLKELLGFYMIVTPVDYHLHNLVRRDIEQLIGLGDIRPCPMVREVYNKVIAENEEAPHYRKPDYGGYPPSTPYTTLNSLVKRMEKENELLLRNDMEELVALLESVE